MSERVTSSGSHRNQYPKAWYTCHLSQWQSRCHLRNSPNTKLAFCDHRDSQTAFAPAHHSIVETIKKRAISLNGDPTSQGLEPLIIQRYAPGGHFQSHHDYFGALDQVKGNRAATLMVYLDAPRLVLWRSLWCLERHELLWYTEMDHW